MSTFSVILIALPTFAIGIAIGALLWRKLGPQSRQSQELEEKLRNAEQRLSTYQAEVAEHFLETSRRVNELTRNYREVHEYLASSAMKLTTPSLGREMQTQINWDSEDSEAAPISDQETQPPQDSVESEPAADKDHP